MPERPKGTVCPKGTPSELNLGKLEVGKSFCYILKSLKTGKFYYGCTDDLDNRLKMHNLGRVKSTKAFRPWMLHYQEEYENRSSARKRELFFKSIDGYLWLKKERIT
jgi:putative endonuclease